MRSKITRRSFLLISFVYVGIIFVVLAVNGNQSDISASSYSDAMLPSPPTPGPEPTSIPRSPDSLNPVNDQNAVIERALLIDSSFVLRDKDLTQENIFKNPDTVLVEWYGTRQEASDDYGFGTYDDFEGSEPVWVVIIKGVATVNDMNGSQEVEGMTYIISQNSGDLLSYATGILQKRDN